MIKNQNKSAITAVFSRFLAGEILNRSKARRLKTKKNQQSPQNFHIFLAGEIQNRSKVRRLKTLKNPQFYRFIINLKNNIKINRTNI